MSCTGSKKLNKISTELTSKQIAMLKANTKFSENEIRQKHVSFLRECQNGSLDKKRFVAVYKLFYPSGKLDSFCKFAFDAFDTKKDGRIDFEEFLLGIATTTQGGIDERLEAAFKMCNVSGNGQINQKELTNLISAMYDLIGETNRKGDNDPKKRAAGIITKLDTNSDKKLSKAEFIAGCKNNLDIRRLLAPNV